MLYNLVRDAAQTLLFRYQAPEAYRYSPLTITAILIALGLQLAAAWAPVFGDWRHRLFSGFYGTEMVGIEPSDALYVALFRRTIDAAERFYLGH